MVSCVMHLLEDVPAAAFQAILRHLRGPDVARLRLVNRFICMRATAAPYIVLRITSSTTRDDLRLWEQATRRLQDISTIHIHCGGKIKQEAFDAALQLLSRRGRVAELHLTSAASSGPELAVRSHHAATLPSLEPLNQLESSLKNLYISGLTVTDLAGDLTKFAVAGRQLQTLVFHDVKWNQVGTATLAAFAAAVLQLPLRYPNLRLLHINVPTIATERTAAPAEATTEQRMEAILASARQLPEHQAAALAVLAATCAQLKELQSFSITEAPGIWPLRSRRSSCTAAGTPGADFALAAAAAAAAAAGGAPQLQLPPKGLHSMDTIGSWLLRRLPQLQHLHLSTRDAVWAMTWQQQQQQGQLCSSRDTSNTSSSQALYGPAPSIKGTYHAFVTAADAAAQPGSLDGVARPIRKLPVPALVSDFAQQLSGHSSRPVSFLLPCITTLQLSIQPQQLPDLQSLLGSLVNLSHLKVTLLNTSSQTCDFAALVAAAAGAGGGKLQSIALLPGNSCVEVASRMLLPLVQCSRLQQLRLVGCFTTAAGDGCAAWIVLRQLTGLKELTIQQRGPDTLQLPVACLPVCLQVLEGRRLHLAGNSSSSNGQVSAAAAAPDMYSHSAHGTAAAALPGLQSLHLQQCRLHDPASLAGLHLQQLTTSASSWQGGWAAAAAAWPRLKRLTACCLSMHSNCSGTCNGEASVLDTARNSRSSRSDVDGGDADDDDGGATISTATSRPCGYRLFGGYDEVDSSRAMLAAWAAGAGQETSRQLVQEIVRGFRDLESVSVQHIPCLTPAVLQVLWQLPALLQLELASTVVSGSWGDVLGRAKAAESEASSSSGASSSTTARGGSGMFSEHRSKGCIRHSLKNLTLYVPHSTPAGQMLSALFISTAQPAEAAATSEHGIGGLSLQQALQRQLPWVGVNVMHARSLPC